MFINELFPWIYLCLSTVSPNEMKRMVDETVVSALTTIALAANTRDLALEEILYMEVAKIFPQRDDYFACRVRTDQIHLIRRRLHSRGQHVYVLKDENGSYEKLLYEDSLVLQERQKDGWPTNFCRKCREYDPVHYSCRDHLDSVVRLKFTLTDSLITTAGSLVAVLDLRVLRNIVYIPKKFGELPNIPQLPHWDYALTMLEKPQRGEIPLLDVDTRKIEIVGVTPFDGEKPYKMSMVNKAIAEMAEGIEFTFADEDRIRTETAFPNKDSFAMRCGYTNYNVEFNNTINAIWENVLGKVNVPEELKQEYVEFATETKFNYLEEHIPIAISKPEVDGVKRGRKPKKMTKRERESDKRRTCVSRDTQKGYMRYVRTLLANVLRKKLTKLVLKYRSKGHVVIPQDLRPEVLNKGILSRGDLPLSKD